MPEFKTIGNGVARVRLSIERAGETKKGGSAEPPLDLVNLIPPERAAG